MKFDIGDLIATRMAVPELPRSEVGLLVPVDEVFPGTPADEATLHGLLQTLSRDDTLFHAARLNTIVSGPGDFDMQPRQQQALTMMRASEEIDRINDFARRHRKTGVPMVFFRGQLLELMRSDGALRRKSSE